ncbi:MAG: aminomethyl-transferring glycine dehydrogenase subunit GcvPA [Alphaproteobacteria bacterium]|nr:aminomethyl-transferring glycine dehydrogenase subunit GcvPA [Alphaproteobacteria bacterium]
MRYLPLTDEDRRAMLEAIGARSVDELFRDVPAEARIDAPFDLPLHKGEIEVARLFEGFAARNVAAGSVPFFVGAGAYRHHVPASVDHLIQRSEFLTAYTPYQPEIAQGTLHYLFEFQTMIARLTGLEVANASMYDGSTATAEAVAMAARLTRRDRTVLAGDLHPHYREVIETTARYQDDEILSLPMTAGPEAFIAAIDESVSAVVVQTPSVFGTPVDLRPIAEAAHARGALLIAVVTEIVSLGLLESPGAMGADIVTGEAQGLGVGLNFGGPYLGIFAARSKFLRQMPGRLVGETVDADGRPGYVLTLSTREQHIRREKATSNICTNSGLCCLAFTIHLELLGEAGFTRLARLNHEAAIELADRLSSVSSVSLATPTFFNEFTLRLPRPAAGVVEALAGRGVLGGVAAGRLYPGVREAENLLIVAVTETCTQDDMDAFKAALEAVLTEGSA